MLDVVSVLGILVVFVFIIHALSKALKLRLEPIMVEDPKKEAALTRIVMTAIFIATCAFEVFRNAVYQPFFQLDERPPFTVSHFDVLFACFFYSLWLIPLLMAMRRSMQSFGSVDISRKNMARMFVFGFLLSAIYS